MKLFRLSASKFVFMFNSCPITCSNRSQTWFIFSLPKRYIAREHSVKESTVLKNMFHDLHINIDVVTMYVHNQLYLNCPSILNFIQDPNTLMFFNIPLVRYIWRWWHWNCLCQIQRTAGWYSNYVLIQTWAHLFVPDIEYCLIRTKIRYILFIQNV